MALGPEVEIVHESAGRWRIWPSGAAIDVEPWRTTLLVGAMQRAGVRINDWRGKWARRHRVLNALGIVALGVSAIAIVVAIALVPLRPGSIGGAIAFAELFLLGVFLGLVLYMAMNFLPWTMSKAEAQLN